MSNEQLKYGLIQFLKEQEETFCHTWSMAAKTADMEAIHKLRVSLKRTAALLRMLNFEKKANYRLKKCFKPFRKIFKSAGPVRDFQVQEQLIKQIAQNLIVDEILVKKITEKKVLCIRNFFLEQKSFHILQAKRNFKLIEHYIISDNENDITRQLTKYEKNLRKMLSIYSNEKSGRFNLHTARKMIKDMAYLIEMQGEALKTEDPRFIVYKDTGHTLGIWHDRAVLYNFLKEINPEETKKISGNIANLTDYLINEKKNLKNVYMESYKNW